MVVAASTTTTAEEAPLSRRKGRRRHRQSIIAAAAAPQFRTPRPPTRPRPSGAAASTTATERESRSSRIRRDGLRRRARQLQRMKRVVDGHALKVAAGEKTKKQQHVYDLTASSSAPSAASASQRWRGVMRRVLDKTNEAPPHDDNHGDDDDDNNGDNDEDNDGSKNNKPDEVVDSSSATTTEFPAAQQQQKQQCHHHQHHQHYHHHHHHQQAPVGDRDSSAHDGNANIKYCDGGGDGGGTASPFFGTTTIAAIAMKARCRDALKVLHYVRKLREERENGTASSRINWVDDNRRCSAIFDLLTSIPAIDSLDFFFRRTLLPKLELVDFCEGEVVFHQDDEEMTVWLILDGRISISSKDIHGTVRHAGELSEGQVIGNLLPEKRLATATCLQQCILLRVNNTDILEALEDPEAKLAVSKKNFFRTVPLFKGLEDRDLDRLTSIFHVATLRDGDVLCREGHRVDNLYLVQRGNFRLLKAFLPRSETKRDNSNNNDASQLRRRQSGRSKTEVEVIPPMQRGHSGIICSTSNNAEASDVVGVVVSVEANDPNVGREGLVEEKRRPDEDEEARPGAGMGVGAAAAAGSGTEAGSGAGAGAKTGAGVGAGTGARAAAAAATALPSLSHFDVGVLGRKDFVGEAGFKAAAFAGAGTVGAKGGGIGGRGSVSGHRSSLPAWDGHSGTAGGGGGGGVGGTHEYIISAVAEGSAEVLAAKVVDLMFMQTVTMKRCWAEGREHHQSRERKWKPATLGAEMRKQVLWERRKRSIVLDHVRTEVLERKLTATAVRGRAGAMGPAGAVGEAKVVGVARTATT